MTLLNDMRVKVERMKGRLVEPGMTIMLTAVLKTITMKMPMSGSVRVATLDIVPSIYRIL